MKLNKYLRPGEDINRQSYVDIATEVLEAYRAYLLKEEPYAYNTIASLSCSIDSLSGYEEEK